ncbi:hypothetical protein MKX03_022433, partial [Papaver bracteatum]
LTLVKRHADSGSLSKPDEDEYRVAVVAFCVKPSFKIVDGNVKNINYDEKVFQIGSDYLDRSPPGQGVLEDAKDFFKYGYSFWGNSDEKFASWSTKPDPTYPIVQQQREKFASWSTKPDPAYHIVQQQNIFNRRSKKVLKIYNYFTTLTNHV